MQLLAQAVLLLVAIEIFVMVASVAWALVRRIIERIGSHPHGG
jgi:hypothetical protein